MPVVADPVFVIVDLSGCVTVALQVIAPLNKVEPLKSSEAVTPNIFDLFSNPPKSATPTAEGFELLVAVNDIGVPLGA